MSGLNQETAPTVTLPTSQAYSLQILGVVPMFDATVEARLITPP